MTIQLTENGLVVQTQAEIIVELAAKLRAQFGPNLRTDVKSIMGMVLLVMAEFRALKQEALAELYASMDPNGAVGAALSARVGLTGTARKGETHSAVSGLLTFSAAGQANTGDRIKNTDNDTLWELVNGPVVATEAGDFEATFRAVNAGPIVANAGTTWELVTTIANCDGFANATDDAELGSLQESDSDLRERQAVELYSRGQGPLDTIAAVVSPVAGVTSVRVGHNPMTFPEDEHGIPFKAINVVVETDPSPPSEAIRQAIANAIWEALGGGGEAFGTSYTIDVLDDEGVPHAISFDIVAAADIVIELDLVTSTSEVQPSENLAAVVKAEILLVAQAQYERVGRDLNAEDITGIVSAMQDAGRIRGVVNTALRMAVSPASPSAVDKLVIGPRFKPDFDSANITVTEV